MHINDDNILDYFVKLISSYIIIIFLHLFIFLYSFWCSIIIYKCESIYDDEYIYSYYKN